MALGDTMVEVIMKNISNRNIMSVIDDIENTSIAFVFLFIMDITVCVSDIYLYKGYLITVGCTPLPSTGAAVASFALLHSATISR